MEGMQLDWIPKVSRIAWSHSPSDELMGSFSVYLAGETGDTSVVSRWKDYEIMFHVAALMPYHQSDKQQVQRKRYIGNGKCLLLPSPSSCILIIILNEDIVCLVFLEGNQVFDPNAIRSKFLHVYIVVRLESVNGETRWR